MIPTILLLIVLPLVLAVSSAWPSRTSTPLLPSREPRTYRVVYDLGRDTTEELRVHRPFDARLQTRVHGRVVGDRASSLTSLATMSEGTGWLGFAIAPVVASGDLRFDGVLRDAIAAKRVEVGERRTVAGRRCQVLRAGSSVRAGLLVARTPGSPTFADICVDGDGLLLEETWTVNGKVVEHRVATKVETDLALGDDAFHPDDVRVVGPSEGGSVARRVDPESGPRGEYLELRRAPRGYRYRGRWAIASTQNTQDPRVNGDRSPRTTSVVDLWVRGADFFVVEQGASLDPLPDLQGDDLRGTEIRLDPADGGFARVYGTVPRGVLQAVAGRLRTTTGTGLRFLD
jgi:hypothetical protein